MKHLLPVLLILASAGAASAETVFPKGLQVGLEPAGDLRPSARFPGFEDSERQVAVTIAELPAAAYETAQRSMFHDLPPGATEVKRESFPFKSGFGYLAAARVTENGATTNRWMLLTTPFEQIRNEIVAVSVAVPEKAAGMYSDDTVRKMLASVTFRDPPIAERLGMMPFKLEDLAGLQVADVQRDTVILSDGSADDSGQHSFMIVAIARGAPQNAADRSRFARDVLSRAPFRELQSLSGDDMRIGGKPGYEIRAKAQGLRGEDLNLVQWVTFNGDAFIRIIGASPPAAWDQMFNRFRAVRDGVAMR